jgi:hypothetical protein
MRVLLTCSVIGLLALAIVPARADIVTYEFTSDHCTGGCSTGLANMGTITLTDLGSGSVSVLVQLQAGFGFVASGAGGGSHDDGGPSFFFRLLGDPTITYSGVSTGWYVPGGIAPNQAPGTYAGDGLMGQFEYALSCYPGAGGCSWGGSAPLLAPPLSFTVTAVGLTAASFIDPGASGSQFAADVLSSNGKTGLIDASLVSVPEPASIILLGTIFVGVAITLRKRARRSS